MLTDDIAHAVDSAGSVFEDVLAGTGPIGFNKEVLNSFHYVSAM